MEGNMKTRSLIYKFENFFYLQRANLDFDSESTLFGSYLSEILRFELKSLFWKSVKIGQMKGINFGASWINLRMDMLLLHSS